MPPGKPYSFQHSLTEQNSRLGSDTLELIAEGGRKSFVVHKNLLIIQSPLLRSAVDTLSADGIFDMRSWDGETVGHFVNFLYLQTYVVPGSQPLSPIVGAPVETASDTTGTRSQVSTPGTICSNNSTQRDLALDANDRRPLTPLSGLRVHPNEGNSDGPDSGHFCPQEANDHHNVLLAHAKVYALSQSLEVHILSSMAYHRVLGILESLHTITPDSHIRLNVVELLDYVYAHPDYPMRKLVSQFVAWNFTAMQGLEEMKELMSRGGQLAVELMAKVSRRLVAGEKEINDQREISKGVTEQFRSEQVNVKVLQLSKERLEKSVKDMVSDMNNSLEQLQSRVLNAGTSEAKRDAIWLQIERLRSKNNISVKALYPEVVTR